MTYRKAMAVLVLTTLAAATGISGQASFRQTQADDYTRYELQDPSSQSFRIIYDVTATTAGATYFFNGIRIGSEPTVHGVTDLMTGRPLDWALVDGAVARAAGHAGARDDTQYIQVSLLRPVPQGGEARIRIDKTYRDTTSYFDNGAEIVFSRTLGIKRNAVVLPEGFELIEVSYPSQIVTESDGRLKTSFLNPGPAGVPYTVRARRLPPRSAAASAPAGPAPQSAGSGSGGPDRSVARVGYRFTERAFQDREIVYFLQPPETHSFRLYHDYTETRPGVDRYVNVVRAGSRASNPSAMVLDTGEKLLVETLKGDAIAARGVDVGGPITDETEAVVIWFSPVEEGQSVRLRIEETYTDPNRYLLYGADLVWDRSFGRPRNDVQLPEGWYVTTNSVPAVVDMTPEGRVRLRYANDRDGDIDVFVKARRRMR